MSHYYNEFNRHAAAWLRQLDSDGLIPSGFVDERSISEVKPDDVRYYKQCHFFAGIGGWAEALRIAGWPAEKPVWTGSCPCQPFSNAGQRKGEEDERHLWPEFRRLISECHPPIIFGEQVASKLGREWLAGVRVDLEDMGYAVGSADLCAASVSSPHIRQRLFWVAHTEHRRSPEQESRTESGSQGGRMSAWLGNSAQQRDGAGKNRRSVAPREAEGRVSGIGGPMPLGGVADSNLLKLKGFTPAREQPEHEQDQRVNFWSDYDVLVCRDLDERGNQRSRRVESASQCMVDGLPSEMEHLWRKSIGEIKEKIELYAASTSSRPGKILRSMREEVRKEYIQWCSGGQRGIPETAVLFVAMCQLERELGYVIYGETSRFSKILRTGMREMQNSELSPCPPSRRELPEQFSGKFTDALRELSQKMALFSQEVSSFIKLGWPLAQGISHRVGLLRGYGNAIVPQVAAEFIKAAMSCIEGGVN